MLGTKALRGREGQEIFERGNKRSPREGASDLGEKERFLRETGETFEGDVRDFQGKGSPAIERMTKKKSKIFLRKTGESK